MHRLLNEGIHLLVSLLTIYALDCIFCASSKGRWFKLHALANAIIVVTSIGDVISVLSRPFEGSTCAIGDSNCQTLFPVYIAIALHIYHPVMFTVTSDDIFHHVAFAGPLTLLNRGLLLFGVCDVGPMANLITFFMTGLPGGIDYWLLAKVKENTLTRLEEKRLNNSINVWLRSPGLVLTATLFFVQGRMIQTGTMMNAEHFENGVPAWLAYYSYTLTLLCVLNGQYYAERVIANFAVNDKKSQWQSTKDKTKHPHPLVNATMDHQKSVTRRVFGC